MPSPPTTPLSQTDQHALQQALKEGFAALNQNDLATAGDACRRALELDPLCAPAHFLVGLVATEAKERRAAHEAFKSVVKLDRDHAAAWAQLAKLNMGEGRIALAERALKEIRRIRPTDPIVLDTVGHVLNQLGEYETANSFFARVNTIAPSKPPFMLNLANNLVFLGEIDAAITLFQGVIALAPDTPQAHWGLANAQKANNDEHIKVMQRLLQAQTNNPRGQAFLYYAIGKEWEDLKEWDQAFAAFAAGAAARRQTVEFDEAAEEALFTTLEATYTREWLERQPPGHPSSAPIFVLGQPRTGTTLIERIISSHSRVHSAGELQQFGLAIRRLTGHNDPKRFSAALFEQAATLPPAAIGEQYLQTTARMQGRTPHFVDKLPLNYLHIPLILAALPNAKIVHLVRDPMDACFASFKQLFADAYLHSYDQGEMARHHLRYRRLMDHWHTAFPGRIIDIGYEATARDLEPNARALIKALDLPWEDACLHFHESTSGVATASAVQVREPAHTRSIGRWRRYGDALEPMRRILSDGGVAIAGVHE
jgi:tetratricopeptide (TPR) repeat protein